MLRIVERPPHPDPLPASGEREIRRHTATGCRHRGDCEFRDMGVLRHQAGDPARAEACAEAVDEVPQLGIPVGGGVPGMGERGLHRFAALGDEGGEPHHVVTEAGIAGLADGGEPVGEQAGDAGGLAQRRAGADLDAVDFVVGAKQRDLQEPGAVLPPLHGGAEPPGEPGDGGEHVVFEADRIGEALLGHVGRQRQARRDRLVLPAERLVEAADEDFAEPRRERRARQVDEIAHALEPDFGERLDRLREKPQRRRRQRRERRPHLLRRHQRGIAIARDAPGAAGGVGDRRAGVQAFCGEAGEQVAAHGGLAAEQVGAAGDVEHEAVGRIEADQRRVAVAPVGDGIEQPAVCRRVARGDGKRGIHRARIGERHAQPQAEALRRIVHGHDPLGALDRLGDDQRLIRRGQAAGEAIGRKPPQPQGEIAPGGR